MHATRAISQTQLFVLNRLHDDDILWLSNVTFYMYVRSKYLPATWMDGCETPSLLSLPTDQQQIIIQALVLRDRLAFRATCKSFNSLSAALNGTFATERWHSAQGTQSAAPHVHVASASIVPACLQGATLFDACARCVVPWPSSLPRVCLVDLQSDGIPLVARTRCDGVFCRGSSMRITHGTTVAFDMPATPLLAASIADRPFPHMNEGSKPGVWAPRAPFPFATPAAAMGVANGWALRLTAYYETTLLSSPPMGGSVCVGLLDGDAVTAVDEWPQHGLYVASALRGTGRGSAFLEHAHDEYGGTEGGTPAHTTRVHWWDGDARTVLGARSRVLDRKRSLMEGDQIGVCINYVAATVCWTHNGERLDDTEIPIDLSHRWHAAVWATGTTSMRSNFGVRVGTADGDECFAFDVLQHESATWHDLHGKQALRELYRRNVPPSKAFLSAFTAGAEGVSSSRSAFAVSAWPWSPGPSWAFAVETHLEPWLHRRRRPLLEAGEHPRPKRMAALEAVALPVERPLPPTSADVWARLAACAPLAEDAELDPTTEGHVVEKALRMLLHLSRVSQAHAAGLLFLRASLPTLLTASPAQLNRLAVEASLPLGARMRLAHGLEAVQRNVQAAVVCKLNNDHSVGVALIGPQLLSSGGHALTSWCEICMLLQLGRLPIALAGALLDAGATARAMCTAAPDALRTLTRRARLSPAFSQRFVDSVRVHLLLASPLASVTEESGRVDEVLHATMVDELAVGVGKLGGAGQQGSDMAEAGRPSSRLTLVLAAVLPTDAVAPCALRLLAHGVSADEVLACVWPGGTQRASQSGLASLLVRTGLAVGPTQSIVGRARIGPPPRLPPPPSLPHSPPPPARSPTLVAAQSSNGTVHRAPAPLPQLPGFVNFRVIVSDPHSIGPSTYLVVHSDAKDWGRLGWTATLRARDEARAAAGESCCFVGSWGGHVPDFTPATVEPGELEVVLALSGEADGYLGWGRALHKEAGAPNETVRVQGGQTTTVHLHVTIGPPVVVRRVRV